LNIRSNLITLNLEKPESMKKPDKDVITAKEKATWQTYVDKRADDFKKLVSPDLVAMNANGVTSLRDELETMSKSETRSFAFNDMKVVMPDANTAIVTCQAKLDGSFSGSDVSGLYNCATIWRMTNGEWRAVFHTTIRAESKPSA
jgi:hypothetical protein